MNSRPLGAALAFAMLLKSLLRVCSGTDVVTLVLDAALHEHSCVCVCRSSLFGSFLNFVKNWLIYFAIQTK